MAQSTVRTSFILNQHQHQQQQPLFRQPLSTAAKPRSTLAAPSPPSPRKFLVSTPATTIPASSSTERKPPMMSFSPSSSSTPTPTPTATTTPSVASSSSTAATSIHPTDEAEEPWVADMRLEYEGELLQLYKDLGESGDLGPQAVQGYLTKVQHTEQKFQLKIEVRREMEVDMEKKRLEKEKQTMAEMLENPSPDFVMRQRIELERIAMKRDADEKKREAEERRKLEREKMFFIPEPDNEDMGQGKGKAPVVQPSIERQRPSVESSDSTHDSDSDSGTGSASSHPSNSTAPTSAHPSPTSNRSYSTVPSAAFQQQPSLTSQRMSVNYVHAPSPYDSMTFGGSGTGPAPRTMFPSSRLVPMSESETENEGDDESPSPTPMLPRTQTLHNQTSYATLNPSNPSLTSLREIPAGGLYGGTSTASDVAQARRASMLPSTGQGTGSWPPRNRSPPSSTITPPAPTPAPTPVTSAPTGPKKLNSASGSYSGLPPAAHSTAPSLNRKVSAASMQSQGESLADKMRREHLASEARFKSSQERRPSLTSMSTSPPPTSSSTPSVVGATGTATGTKPSPPPRSSTYPQPSSQAHTTPTPPPTTYTNVRTSTPTSMSSSAGAGAGVGAGVSGSGAARKPSGPNPTFRAPSTGTSSGARSATGTYGSSTTSSSASGVPPRSSSTSTAGAAPRAGSTSGPSASSTSSGPKKQHEYTDDDYARAQEEEERFRARRLASSISSSSSSTAPSIKAKISTAYSTYEKRWSNTLPALSAIRWEDIPWPVLEPHKVLDVEGLKVMEIASFLLSPWHSEGRNRKDRIKGELLRWHPDRFEGKYLERVRFGGVSLGGKTRDERDAEERDKVKRGVGEVARALSELLRMDLGGGFAD